MNEFYDDNDTKEAFQNNFLLSSQSKHIKQYTKEKKDFLSIFIICIIVALGATVSLISFLDIAYAEQQQPQQQQLLASITQKKIITVFIVENASNPANKIFYDPSPITIKKGVSILWTNKDPTIHTVTSGKTDNDSTTYKFDSGMLTFSSTYIHKFDKEGIYYYHCYVHPFMTGVVNVIK